MVLGAQGQAPAKKSPGGGGPTKTIAKGNKEKKEQKKEKPKKELPSKKTLEELDAELTDYTAARGAEGADDVVAGGDDAVAAE